MKEIEAKFKVVDKEHLTQQLKQLGGNHVKTLQQTDTYFFHNQAKKLQGGPTYLRVRTSDQQSFVSLHYKLENYVWEEIELQVEDANRLKTIFELTGHEIDIEVKKNRQVFHFEGAEIVIDEVEGLGTYMEVEAKTLDIMNHYCTLLNLDLAKQAIELEGKSYADLVRENK